MGDACSIMLDLQLGMMFPTLKKVHCICLLLDASLNFLLLMLLAHWAHSRFFFS